LRPLVVPELGGVALPFKGGLGGDGVASLQDFISTAKLSLACGERVTFAIAQK
jgi:hypothetical protein